MTQSTYSIWEMLDKRSYWGSYSYRQGEDNGFGEETSSAAKGATSTQCARCHPRGLKE